MSLGEDYDPLYGRRLREQQPPQRHFAGQDVIRKLNDAIKPVQEQPNQNPKTYCVDFDGVLHQHESGDGAGPLGQPLEPGMRLAKRIKAAGHKLVILTARPEEQHHTIHGWLKGHGVKADDVTNKKPPAEMYIDDRAHRWPRNAGAQQEAREGGPGSGPQRRQEPHENALLKLLPKYDTLKDVGDAIQSEFDRRLRKKEARINRFGEGDVGSGPHKSGGFTTFYHGTHPTTAEKILKGGLKSGKAKGGTWSARGTVYLSSTPKNAKNWGEKSVTPSHRERPAVLKVRVPDKIASQISQDTRNKPGTTKNDYTFKGSIPAKYISIEDPGKKAGERDIYGNRIRKREAIEHFGENGGDGSMNMLDDHRYKSLATHETGFREHGVQGQKWHHHKGKEGNALGLEKRDVETQDDALKLVKEALEQTKLKRLMYSGDNEGKTNMRLALYQAAGLDKNDYDNFNDRVRSWVNSGSGKDHPIRLAAKEIAEGADSSGMSGLAKALLLENAINRVYYGERETVKLYRSMDGKLGKALAEAKKAGKDYISVEFNHADHWSTDFHSSREFGSAQFRKVFPSKDILLSYKTNSIFDNYEEEKEHVPLVRGSELTFAIRNKKQNDDGAWAQSFGGKDDD